MAGQPGEPRLIGTPRRRHGQIGQSAQQTGGQEVHWLVFLRVGAGNHVGIGSQQPVGRGDEQVSPRNQVSGEGIGANQTGNNEMHLIGPGIYHGDALQWNQAAVCKPGVGTTAGNRGESSRPIRVYLHGIDR